MKNTLKTGDTIMVLREGTLVPDVVTSELTKVDGITSVETANNGLVPVSEIWLRSTK